MGFKQASRRSIVNVWLALVVISVCLLSSTSNHVHGKLVSPKSSDSSSPTSLSSFISWFKPANREGKFLTASSSAATAKPPPPKKQKRPPPPRRRRLPPPPKRRRPPPPKKLKRPPPPKRRQTPTAKKTRPPPKKRSPPPSPPPRSPPPRGAGVDDSGSAAGPTCGGVGQCCSNTNDFYPAGTPMMPSMWWSAQMAHGAKIQIRETTWSRWWVPLEGTNWNGAITQQGSKQPDATQYFTVLRVSDSQIQLLTPGFTYVYAGPPDPNIGGGCCQGAIATTTNGSDPLTVFTVVPVPGRSWAVYFKCADGYWISGNADAYLLRWSFWNPDAWERHDILEVKQVPAIRGPNVGSWLAIERWMVPDLYTNPMRYNDGTSVQIKSVSTGKWLYSGSAISSVISCSQSTNYETFHVVRASGTGGAFRFKTWWFQYWSMAKTSNNKVYGNADTVGTSGKENFILTFQSSTSKVAVILAPNGKYLRAWSNGDLTADISKSSLDLKKSSTWTGPCAFLVNDVDAPNGEFQASKEFGSDASRKFTQFRDTFMQEQDWVYLRDSGANAVRLTIGWWVQDNVPVPLAPGQPWPFNYNGTRYLDWAFDMAQKYGVRMFLSIHGAPGSQSGWGNTGTQTGMIEWPLQKNVNATLDFVRWLCVRYVQNPMFLGISLLNEPVMWGVPNNVVQQYYMDAYNIVRSYSQCLYVSIAARIGSNEWSDVIWVMTMPGYTNVIVEVHAYQVFGGVNGVSTGQDEINWVQTQRLKQITDLQSTGRNVLIGEFSNAMYSGNVDDATQAAFARAQLQTFSKAKSGWFFWSLKLQRNGYDHWNWYKSIAKGWLPKNPDTGTWY